MGYVKVFPRSEMETDHADVFSVCDLTVRGALMLFMVNWRFCLVFKVMMRSEQTRPNFR